MVNLNSKRLEDILKFANGVMILVLINLLVSDHFFRIDMTEEKRFSISQPTREMLSQLDDNVYIDVYLEGDLPAGLKRLQLAIRETLEEFRVYSGNKVQYTFIDPEQASSSQSRDDFMMSIAKKGIQPTDVFLTKNGNRIQKRILPGAVVSYGIREKGVLLFKGNKGASSEMRLNQSAEEVEYNLASTIKSLTKESAEIIGLSTGHGELAGPEILGLTDALKERYVLKSIDLDENALNSMVDLLIIAKPESEYSPSEKYKLDQYIMSGGKVIFFLDELRAESDSVVIAFPYDLNLDDLLFKYGVRINKDLVQDLFSLDESVMVGNMGDQPQIQKLPWPFYPLINNFSDHAIVRNMDAVSARYISSIDTVKAEGVTKTPLMFSSIYSRSIQAPLRIDLNELKKPMDPDNFNQSNIPVAYLLEGSFTSLFKNRPLPSGADNGNFKEEGSSALIVIGDGDIAANNFNPQTGNPLPLGFDYTSGQTFANKEFILNAIEYLFDEEGLIQARKKEIVLRPLDKVKIGSERTKWEAFNLITPIVLLILYGLIAKYIRKKKYSSF